jgi:hypothetical protein
VDPPVFVQKVNDLVVSLQVEGRTEDDAEVFFFGLIVFELIVFELIVDVFFIDALEAFGLEVLVVLRVAENKCNLYLFFKLPSGTGVFNWTRHFGRFY